MDSSRSAAESSRRKRIGGFASAGCAAALLVVMFAPMASADPSPPSLKDLKDQATKAQNQLETLTERYNGYKVQLDQAAKAAQVAGDNAKRQQAALQQVQHKIGQLAASSYMSGGLDPTVAFAVAKDPQQLLDQASTLNYFAAQDGTQVQSLAQAMQSAVRAGKAATDRANEVKALKAQLDTQRQQLENLYNTARQKIAKQDPSQLANIPTIPGGSSKAVEALHWALKELGKPYVWGAAGPNTFDCSGLTMWAYGKVGISLPHFTGSQWNSGTHVPRDKLQPGDLVFFYSDVHHMGMYIGNGMFVHAPHTGDVVRIAPLAGRPFAGGVRVA